MVVAVLLWLIPTAFFLGVAVGVLESERAHGRTYRCLRRKRTDQHPVFHVIDGGVR